METGYGLFQAREGQKNLALTLYWFCSDFLMEAF
jgi:hypothetical protein